MKALAQDTQVWANGLVACEQDCPPDPSQIEICRRWLRAFCLPRKALYTTYSSYGLKHIAENWVGAYATNGAFIAAAFAEGYRVVPTRRGGPNAYFNLAIKKTAFAESAAGAGVDANADLLGNMRVACGSTKGGAG